MWLIIYLNPRGSNHNIFLVFIIRVTPSQKLFDSFDGNKKKFSYFVGMSYQST